MENGSNPQHPQQDIMKKINFNDPATFEKLEHMAYENTLDYTDFPPAGINTLISCHSSVVSTAAASFRRDFAESVRTHIFVIIARTQTKHGKITRQRSDTRRIYEGRTS